LSPVVLWPERFPIGKFSYPVDSLTHNTPMYFERNLTKEKFEGFSPLNYAILSFGKGLNYEISGFQRGDIF